VTQHQKLTFSCQLHTHGDCDHTPPAAAAAAAFDYVLISCQLALLDRRLVRFPPPFASRSASRLACLATVYKWMQARDDQSAAEHSFTFIIFIADRPSSLDS